MASLLMARKPQQADGYSLEETELVRSACLTIAAILGDLMNDVCIVGGLVPSMICEAEVDPAAVAADAHCGTMDLDVGLSLALLDDERYKEMAERLRERGFKPDKNEDDNETRQRWRWGDLKVTIDFLIPPASEEPDEARIQNLESDMAALVVKPLHLAFEEAIAIELEGRNLFDDQVKRSVNFAGPAAFLALKAFAYRNRAQPKDAYDLYFVLTRWGGGVEDICERLLERAENRPEIVTEAIGYLQTDFESIDSPGPRDVSRFIGGDVAANLVADAHGAVADFLRSYERAQQDRHTPRIGKRPS
jgi:predicted nucleotidyltransferase